MNSGLWLYPFILAAGALQAAGASMNGQLNKSIGNPWLASTVSFLLVTFAFVSLFAVLPRPLPSTRGIETMPWWAPLGGLAGAVAVFAGLTLVQKVGAGPLNGLTITANLIASLAIDHFALFGMSQHSLNPQRLAGAVLMIAGVALIARF
jgi:transporter family-2 protein